jgi:hypothetical protein
MSDIILDKPPVPIGQEIVKTPEAQIKEIVGEVDSVFDRVGDQRVAGGRKTACGQATNLVKRAAENKGMPVSIYRVVDIQERLGGIDIDSFSHVFDVINAGTKKFLIDLSFCQFIDPQTHEVKELVHGVGPIITGNLDTSTVALALLNSGYVELTDASLREYLRLTYLDSANHVQNASVGNLDRVTPRPYDYPTAELDDWLSGKTKL